MGKELLSFLVIGAYERTNGIALLMTVWSLTKISDKLSDTVAVTFFSHGRNKKEPGSNEIHTMEKKLKQHDTPHCTSSLYYR
jgi:hypothetical protein